MVKASINMKEAERLSKQLILLLDNAGADECTSLFSLCVSTIIVGRIINGEDEPQPTLDDIQAMIEFVQSSGE